MDDIARALADAWQKIRPRLARDENELRRRLLRRRAALLQSPPRAWCIALRASDTRIPDETCLPADPITLPPSFVQHSSFSIQHSPHSLTFDSEDLRDLCAPVELLPPGETIRAVADKLGCHPGSLTSARIKGIFRTHHIEGLGGYWGHPTPILYTPEPLDPATRNFIMPDPLWSLTARHIGSRIPDRIRATLIRVPVFHDETRAYRDKSNLHPEHPAVDQTFDTKPRHRSKKLPPPAPDHVSYKWKGDVFVGYDWRAAETNPRIRQRYERRQRFLAHLRAHHKRRRRENPPPSQSQGSLKFRGWAWLCPRCNRQVRILLYPLPRLHMLPGKIPRLPPAEMKKLALPHPRNQYFACERCHRVRRISRCEPGCWNYIVTYLSAGLLYGHEVQRPSWLKRQRKRKYAPKPTRQPSQTRLKIEHLLCAGRTQPEIAAQLHLTRGTVNQCVHLIYKQHGVHSLKQFLAKDIHRIPTGAPVPAAARAHNAGPRRKLPVSSSSPTMLK